MSPHLAYAVIVSVFSLGSVQSLAQSPPVALRSPAWAAPAWDSLTLQEQRAILAPPVYWFGGDINRVALERSHPLRGHAVLVDWHTAGGTGSSENTFFLVYPNQDGPPTLAWRGLSEAHAYDNDGRLLDRIRACLYLIGDSALAYVPIRDPSPPVETIWDSLTASGIYRLGTQSNLTELQVYRLAPVPPSIQARCRAELARTP